MAVEVDALAQIREKINAETAENWVPRSTLTGPQYTGTQTWDKEKEKIFYSEWMHVGREEEIPEAGDFMVRPVGEETIIINRTKSGEIKAFYNVYPHRGTKLCDDGGGQHAKS